MKRKINALFIIMLIAGTAFIACNSANKKPDEKQDNLTSEQLAINKQAISDSVVQLQKQTNEKINANEQAISDLRDKLANESSEIKKKYEKKLEELDQKNSDLKIKLEEYKEDGTDKWEKFKKEYLKDIDSISESVKDFTAKIVK